MLIPESERRAYDCVNLNRQNLSRFIWEFERTIELFALIEQLDRSRPTGTYGFIGPLRDPISYYRIIAARDGALNAYHFFRTLKAVHDQLLECPSICREVDSAAVAMALAEFDAMFPNIGRVRQAVAHAGELVSSPAKMAVTMRQGHYLAGGLAGNTFSIGHSGKTFSITLDKSSVAVLSNIKAMIDRAFQALQEQN